MSLLVIKTRDGDYLEADDRERHFYIAAHSRNDNPISYARLTKREARLLRDQLARFLRAKKRVGQ